MYIRKTSALILAIKLQNFENVYKFLMKYPDVDDKQYRRCIQTAVIENGPDSHKIVQLLLDYGFKVHPRDVINPKFLHSAIEKGYIDIVKSLLKYGANVNVQRSSRNGLTPLHTAVIHGRYEIAQLLLRFGASPNVKDKLGRTPFHFLVHKVSRNVTEMTEILLTRGDRMKNTIEILNAAILCNNSNVVEILLQGDVDPNGWDKRGMTSLHCNARCIGNVDEKIKIARMLFKKGAKVNAPRINGETPLHIAVSMPGHVEYVYELLMHNADVNAITHENVTPLHQAAFNGDIDICSLLVNFGALLNEKSSEGHTAVQFAKLQGHFKLAKLLEFGPSFYDSVVQYKRWIPQECISA